MALHQLYQQRPGTIYWDKDLNSGNTNTKIFTLNDYALEFGTIKNYCDSFHIQFNAGNNQSGMTRYDVFYNKVSNGIFIDREGNKTTSDGYNESLTFLGIEYKVVYLRFKNSLDVMRIGTNRISALFNPTPDKYMHVNRYFQVFFDIPDAKNPAPSLSSLSASSTNNYIDNPLNITWAGNNVGVTKVYVNGSLKTTTAAGVKSVSLPAFTCVEGQNTIKVVTENRPEPNILPSLGGVAEKEITISMSRIKPTVSGLRFETSSTLIDDQQTVSWSSANQSAYNLKINGVSRHTGGTEKSYTIPKYLFNVGENTLEIEVIYNAGNGSRLSAAQSIKKTFTRLEPTVSNLRFETSSTLIDDQQTVSWSSANQSAYNLKINGVNRHTGGAEKDYTIPKYLFNVGENTLEIEVIYNSGDGSRLSAAQSIKKTFTRLVPGVSSIAVNNTNRDYTTRLTWSNQNVTSSQVFINNTLISNLTTQTTLDIPAFTFANGKNIVLIRATYTGDSSNKVTTDFTEEFTFTQNEPIIHGLEPSNLNINIDASNDITFSANSYVTRWELKSGKYTWTGTNERVINVAGGAFSKGLNTLALTVFYSPNANETRTTSMSVQFTGYGKPLLPVQDQTTVYPGATPTLTWTYGTSNDSDRQIEYEIKVLEGSATVYTKRNVGGVGSDEITTDLKDKTRYVSMVRIKNRYDLWSDWSAKNFETLFSQANKPTMQVYQQGSGVAISALATQNAGFRENRIYRRYIGGEWVELAAGLGTSASIIDHTAAGGVIDYKCRSYDTSGGYTESNIYKVDMKLQRTILCDATEPETSIVLSSVTSAISYVSDNKTMLFAGASKPRIYKSNTNYKVLSLDVTLGDNAELQNLLLRLGRGQIYCLRDWRGECGYYGITISGIKRSGMYQVLSMTLTEVNFNEYRMYSAGYKDVIYTDGGYILQMR